MSQIAYKHPPQRTIARLSVYRRILAQDLEPSVDFIHSHQLASRAGVSAAQVRRDLMQVGCLGNPRRGYPVRQLLDCLITFLSGPECQKLVLVGVGNLGQALLSYFMGGRSHLSIVAAFDADAGKAGRVVHGCRCHPLQDLKKVLHDEQAFLAVLCIPAPGAQAAADTLVEAGVRGIVNFAGIPLSVPSDVYVENVDLTTSLEKVAFFAREKVQTASIA